MMAKLDNTLRRMCTPTGRYGRLEVSADARAQWLKGGAPRKHLLDILVKFNGDKDCVAVSNTSVCVQMTYRIQYGITCPRTFPSAGGLQEAGGAH